MPFPDPWSGLTLLVYIPFTDGGRTHGVRDAGADIGPIPVVPRAAARLPGSEYEPEPPTHRAG